jgi:hypothetical protein
MKENDIGLELLQRLDIIICLLLDASVNGDAVSVASKVYKLDSLGLSPSEISKILGKPINYVTAIKSTRRARGGKK